ncbi:MAG TPA: chemotaxis protein CheX [Bryobacteraceae bacterium]|nr:chemotaxis protein CheX [Bryobacteraceae bacterium]
MSTMFFTGICDEIPSHELPPERVLTSIVHFHGPLSGAFKIAVSERPAATLATDFYGAESEVDREAVDSVIGELGNIVCGAVLSHLDPAGLFTLDTPQLDAEVLAPFGLTRCFVLTNGLVAVSLKFE